MNCQGILDGWKSFPGFKPEKYYLIVSGGLRSFTNRLVFRFEIGKLNREKRAIWKADIMSRFSRANLPDPTSSRLNWRKDACQFTPASLTTGIPSVQLQPYAQSLHLSTTT